MESKFDTVVAVFVSFCIGYPVVSNIMPAMSFWDYVALGDIYWCRRKYKRMESNFDTVVAVFVSFCIGYPVVSTMMPTMSSSLDVQSRFLDVVGNLK
jgi:divalent metal cation (Fe/Co/Zn/Cd) transporter